MKRAIRHTVRFSEEEWELLEKKAKESEAGKYKYGKREEQANVSAYIRQMLFKEEVEEYFYLKELKNLTYQMRKIGVNINQAVAKLNSGHQSRDTVFYLQKNLQQLEKKVKNLMEKLEENRCGDYKTNAH